MTNTCTYKIFRRSLVFVSYYVCPNGSSKFPTGKYNHIPAVGTCWIYAKKEAPVNFLPDPSDGRSILRPSDVLVFGWVGGKHACVDLTGLRREDGQIRPSTVMLVWPSCRDRRSLWSPCRVLSVNCYRTLLTNTEATGSESKPSFDGAASLIASNVFALQRRFNCDVLFRKFQKRLYLINV
nr:auxilin-like protein [Tanacetum cinerariifolium]